ncbi:hypothetical protein ACFQAS_01525 [Halopenitus salinus]|uniref:Uncharacterized protein n=1 Tax=Halopenitus salinus TaxID=1198295 RepID=A0ABD5UWQ6_9EURY
MSSDSSSECEFQIQEIAGLAVRPDRGISDGNRTRLSVAKRTLDQNYFEIDEYVDGDLETNPIFICHNDEREEEGFEALRLLHNYLASLYSFNETIRVLFNQHSPDGISLASRDFTPTSGGTDRLLYSRKLAFLRGLRTDFQHGGFSCFAFNKAGDLGDFAGYHIVFEREAFMNDSGLSDPNRFLRHTNTSEQQYPLCFLGLFHKNTLQTFYEDTDEWFCSY